LLVLMTLQQHLPAASKHNKAEEFLLSQTHTVPSSEPLIIQNTWSRSAIIKASNIKAGKASEQTSALIDIRGTTIECNCAHRGSVTSLQLCHSNQDLITLGTDGYMRLWRIVPSMIQETLALEIDGFGINTQQRLLNEDHKQRKMDTDDQQRDLKQKQKKISIKKKRKKTLIKPEIDETLKDEEDQQLKIEDDEHIQINNQLSEEDESIEEEQSTNYIDAFASTTAFSAAKEKPFNATMAVIDEADRVFIPLSTKIANIDLAKSQWMYNERKSNSLQKTIHITDVGSVNEAHFRAVTCCVGVPATKEIITGGMDGLVNFWTGNDKLAEQQSQMKRF
ncbi:MAG: hypothetical protein EZS28_006485, partial [Streblomastix strix]